MNNEMTNKTLTSAIDKVNNEVLTLTQTAMCNAYDNVIEMLSKKVEMYLMVLGDHAKVLDTSYGDRWARVYEQKQKVWSKYYMIQEIYGKVCEMRYNTILKVKR